MSHIYNLGAVWDNNEPVRFWDERLQVNATVIYGQISTRKVFSHLSLEYIDVF